MAVHKKTLTNRAVAALKVERDMVYWDRDLPGFGVRVYPGGGKVYIAQAREPGKKVRRVTVGRHDVLNADRARQRAAFIIARIRAGEDPVPLPLAARFNGGPSVADLAERYLEEHAAVRLKPRTQLRVAATPESCSLAAAPGARTTRPLSNRRTARWSATWSAIAAWKARKRWPPWRGSTPRRGCS